MSFFAGCGGASDKKVIKGSYDNKTISDNKELSDIDKLVEEGQLDENDETSATLTPENATDSEHGGNLSGYVPEPSGTVTLTVPSDVYTSEYSRQTIRNWISAFKEKYPNVTVKEDFSHYAQYATRISAKDIGDVFWLVDTEVYDYAVFSQALMPLDRYAKAYNIELNDVYSGFLELGRVDGQLYMIATNCGQQTFTYNKDMLSAANLEMPEDDWTWDEFKTYVEALTMTAEDGTITQVGAVMDVFNSPLYVPFLVGYGGQWCDTVNKKINLTSDEVIMGFGELITQLEEMNIYPISGSAGSIFTYADMGTSSYATAYANIQGNIQANAAFMQLDSFANLYARGNVYENLGIDWDVVAFPLFDSPASPCGSFGYGVLSYTENPDAAAALCLSIYTQEGQKAINTGAGGAAPLLSSLAGETFWHLTGEGYEDKNYSAFVANTSRYIPGQVKCEVPADVAEIIRTGMIQLFKDFYQGGRSWQDSLAAIEEQAEIKWSTLS